MEDHGREVKNTFGATTGRFDGVRPVTHPYDAPEPVLPPKLEQVMTGIKEMELHAPRTTDELNAALSKQMGHNEPTPYGFSISGLDPALRSSRTTEDLNAMLAGKTIQRVVRDGTSVNIITTDSVLANPELESILWVQFTAEARKKQLSSAPRLVTTFRKGTKWLRPDLIGKRVRLVNCHAAHMGSCTNTCEVFAHATVISVKASYFADIDLIDHDRQSSEMTTPAQRLNTMVLVYGEYDVTTVTTVITLGNISLV